MTSCVFITYLYRNFDPALKRVGLYMSTNNVHQLLRHNQTFATTDCILVHQYMYKLANIPNVCTNAYKITMMCHYSGHNRELFWWVTLVYMLFGECWWKVAYSSQICTEISILLWKGWGYTCRLIMCTTYWDTAALLPLLIVHHYTMISSMINQFSQFFLMNCRLW